MPPRRVLPSRHARTGIISYSDTIGAGTLQVPSGGAEVGGTGGEIGASEYSTYNNMSDEENGDDIDEVSSQKYQEGVVIFVLTWWSHHTGSYILLSQFSSYVFAFIMYLIPIIPTIYVYAYRHKISLPSFQTGGHSV